MSVKPYVFITRKIPETFISRLEKVAEVGMWNQEEEPVPRNVLLEEVQRADALFTMVSDDIDQEVLEAGKRLKIIANLGSNNDNIDLETAYRKKVFISNTSKLLTETTADLAFSLILMTGRRLAEAIMYVKEGKWKGWSPFLLAGADIHNKTLGIVGMGKIGEAVAKRALGFRMNVIYHNRDRKIDIEDIMKVDYRSIDDLISESDYVLNLTPLTEETKGMFNKETFKKMKKTAFFINVGRGETVVERDLIEALKNGEIAGAGLDVYENEPVSMENPLIKMNNVVALPNIGSSSVETRMSMINQCCENIERVLQNITPISMVN